MSSQKCNSRFCHEEGVLRCARCLAVYYCGRECQKCDWKSHKSACLPPIQVQQRNYDPRAYLYEVNFDKFYSKAGILPQQEKELIKMSIEIGDGGSVTINIFAPKLESVPEPHTLSLPADADTDSNESIFTTWNSDLDPKTGEIFCTSMMIAIMKNQLSISDSPKMLMVRMISRSELPEKFWRLRSRKKDGINLLGGPDVLREMDELLVEKTGRGLLLPEPAIENANFERDLKPEWAFDDVDEEEKVIAALAALRGTKSEFLCLEVTISALEEIVALAQGSDFNKDKLVDNGVVEAIVGVFRAYGGTSAKVAVLCCGILNLLSLADPARKVIIGHAAGAIECIISAMVTFPIVSTAIAPALERPECGLALQFVWPLIHPSLTTCETLSYDQDVQKWGCAAIAALSTDTSLTDPPEPRRSLARKGALEAVVHALRLHIGIPRSDVLYYAMAALTGLASGKFQPEEDAARKKLGDLGACELVCTVIRDNIHDLRLMEFAVFAVKTLAMNDSNRLRLGNLGACADVYNALRSNMRNGEVTAAVLRATGMLAHAFENMARLRDAGACELIVEAVNRHLCCASVADAFSRALQNLCCPSYYGDPQNSLLLGVPACQAIVKVLETHNGHPVVTEYAAKALHSMCVNVPTNRACLRSLGALEIMQSVAASASYSGAVRKYAKIAVERLQEKA